MMKKPLLLVFAATLTAFSAGAQTAANFNCNDCAGNNHDLFTELNAGKVIVISWVMPCGSCLGPTLTASNVVQSYASSNPGQVLMYVADDAANTTCTSLNSWVNSNGIVATTFSNSAVDMGDYGSPGMPKIVVLGGGSAHTVFFNQNNSAAGNSSAIQNAIDAALATGVNDPANTFSPVSLFPNPANDIATISFSTTASCETTVEIFNHVGQNVMTAYTGTLAQGENKIGLNVAELAAGVYFVKVSDAVSSRMVKLVVSR